MVTPCCHGWHGNSRHSHCYGNACCHGCTTDAIAVLITSYRPFFSFSPFLFFLFFFLFSFFFFFFFLSVAATSNVLILSVMPGTVNKAVPQSSLLRGIVLLSSCLYRDGRCLYHACCYLFICKDYRSAEGVAGQGAVTLCEL